MTADDLRLVLVRAVGNAIFAGLDGADAALVLHKVLAEVPRIVVARDAALEADRRAHQLEEILAASVIPRMVVARITADLIQREVAMQYEITATRLLEGGRTPGIVLARQVAMYLVRELAMQSYPEIGRRFRGKDHTTVMCGCKRVRQLLAAGDPDVTRVVESVTAKLRPVDVARAA